MSSITNVVNTSYQNIPKGTYPENRLIDGAFGSYEDVVAAVGDNFVDGVGGESTLDFQSALPLIWPQKPVLFQTDDELYEIEGTEGWMNSRLASWSSLPMIGTNSFTKPSLTQSTAVTAPTVPLARLVIVLMKYVQILYIQTNSSRHR